MNKFSLKYTGLWYEIRRYEARNQTEFDCVTARYSPLLDGSVEIDNSGWFEGRFERFVGNAVRTSQVQAKLAVTFFPGREFIIFYIIS